MRASRLMSILMLLQSRGRISARALAEQLEVSTRTVYRDIDELSAAGVPVVVERGAQGGFELLGGWRTTLTGLTPKESQTLFLAGLPGPVAELGLGDTMASAHLKVLAALPREWQIDAQRVTSRFHVDLAGWYRRTKPVLHLRTLADAVWADRWITISYDSWDGLVTRTLEPLGLVVKAGEWYLAARSRKSTSPPRTYRVANIRELTVEDAFTRPGKFDLAAYWIESTRRFERDIYRGTADVKLSARGRRLLCDMSAAVEDAIDRAAKPDARGWLRATIPIESLEHAVGQLLGLGTDVEVIGPPALRARLHETARAVAGTYERGLSTSPRASSASARRRSR